jgi:hypothetical protein
LLDDPSEEVLECLRHAEDCAREAATKTSPKIRADFLDLERRWRSLARSYEFTERLGDFCARYQAAGGALPIPPPEVGPRNWGARYADTSVPRNR